MVNKLDYIFKVQEENVMFMYRILNLDLNNEYKMNIYVDDYLLETINLDESNLLYTNFTKKFDGVKNKKMIIKVLDNNNKNVENAQIELINFRTSLNN